MKKILFSLLVMLSLIFPNNSFAEGEKSCGDRYVTFVNPVRSRELWQDKSLKPIEAMYHPLKKHEYSGTWLLQYDVFLDSELVNYIKQFNQKQEKGLFLEISEKLAQDSKVFFNSNTAWYHPEVVFLSAYEQSERRRLIDRQFLEFESQFGYYPKSVGAWWIDSYSLDYMQKKYGITSVMIVADQLSTDRYGVWGQWWGVVYLPSRSNVLVPAENVSEKLPVTVIQWAQRHPERAYGDTSTFSNFSLQANDYIRLGLDTSHFKSLVQYYLQCTNRVGQVTIGLEVGQESVEFIDEYKRQLDYLKTISLLQSVTMSYFSDRFRIVYPGIVPDVQLESSFSAWLMDTSGRRNKLLSDTVSYKHGLSFLDYFKADKSGFLDRNLNGLEQPQNEDYYPFYILVILGFGVLFYRRDKVIVFFVGVVLLFSMYGLFLRSYFQYGRLVYFGPEVPHLWLWQIVLVNIFFGLILLLVKKVKSDILILFYCVTFIFGFDFLLSLLRYTVIEQGSIFGVSFDGFRVYGVAISGSQILFQQFDFPARVAGALRVFPFTFFYQNPLIYFVISPLIHFVIGTLLFLGIKRYSKKFQIIVLIILAIPLGFHLLQIVQADPLSVR